MKKSFKILSALLTIIMLFCVAGCNPAKNSNKDELGLTYTSCDNGTAYFLASSGDFKGENLTIPATFKGLPVVGINDAAFLNSKQLKNIVIPSSVRYIGNQAFNGCETLNSITIEENSVLESIGTKAFYGCYLLRSFDLPASVKVIGEFAFSGCIRLRTFTIPANSVLERIEPLAFNECVELQSLLIPSTVTSIGTSAFFGCTALQYYEKGGGRYLGNPDSPYTWLMGVTSKTITILEVDESCKHIFAFALQGCSALKQLVVHPGIVTIDSKAFEGATGLEYNVHGNGRYVGDEENPYLIFMGLSSEQVTNVDIADGCQIIAPYAFRAAAGLISVDIPASVRMIGQYAFIGAYDVQSINLGTLSGWKAGSAFLDEAELSNPETRKTYLISTYFSMTWTR